MSPGSKELLTSTLRDVSRSFYLTLRVLPAAIRPQIGLAYLLARTTDTIADTDLLPIAQRLDALKALRERIEGSGSGPLDFSSFVGQQGSSAECLLLENCEAALAELGRLSPADRDLVRRVLRTITSGQELDLRRFTGASATHIVALQSDLELDDYTYRVAGCVGEFWTRMCRAHLFPATALDERELLANGVRFGKGLQLVNILRDLAKDLRQGRCYLPAERLAGLDLQPGDLLEAGNERRLRPVYDGYLARAEEHLKQGWIYTNTVPRRFLRVRLACAWPILIGLETIELLRTKAVLGNVAPVKISRRRLRWLMLVSVVYYPCQGRWRALVNPEPRAR
ncbi:MAG TPA: phytoene/squalene synthase family protein [Verrucomicrobiae bacterium]